MDKRYPLTFHTLLIILDMCSCFENLNRNRFGPRTAKEKGMAKTSFWIEQHLQIDCFEFFGR
jgi:hypothetical protein